MKTEINFWFTIEPYVFIDIKKNSVLLYNTLDGVVLESNNDIIIDLLKETLQEKNCGVLFLSNERYNQKDIKDFINELKEKYMGDIIDVNLSKGKPVQLLPYFNFSKKKEIYKEHNFSSLKNALDSLSEISIHVDDTTKITKLIPFIQSIPGSPTFNIVGNILSVENYNELISFFDQHPSPKNILSSYKNVIALQPFFMNNFSYRVSVHFPIDMHQWKLSRKILFEQTLPVDYVFDVSSEEDCQQAEQIAVQFEIEKFRLNPVYNGKNISFFEKNVFLTKEDILSTSITIKDFFSRQAMNVYNYGKINIMPNGDVYANFNHPLLGNIDTDNIYEIVNKEVNEGKSWFEIRNQEPCCDCVYQWLCPPPSIYEISIGRTNLCHIKLKTE